MLLPSKDDFRHKREDHLECISWRLLTRLTFNFEDAQLLSCHLIKSLNLMSELISGGHTEHLLREQEKLHSSSFHNKCFNKSVIEYFGEFRVQSFELRSIIMNSIIALSRVQHVWVEAKWNENKWVQMRTQKTKGVCEVQESACERKRANTRVNNEQKSVDMAPLLSNSEIRFAPKWEN